VASRPAAGVQGRGRDGAGQFTGQGAGAATTRKKLLLRRTICAFLPLVPVAGGAARRPRGADVANFSTGSGGSVLNVTGYGASWAALCIKVVAANRAHDSRLRKRVLLRDRHCCVYCGGAFPPSELTLDHVQPRMRGGDSSEGNVVTCCQNCNALKGGLAAWAFLAKHPALRANFFEAVAQCDASQARPVWDRLLRAIREAIA
jgi:hypothetical protein